MPFPSPCGVWVVSREQRRVRRIRTVSVPLRGVGCFSRATASLTHTNGFRPLAGCGLFLYCRNDGADDTVSVPLRGVGCFRQGAASATGYQGFPSPCGVWVVSSTDTTRTQTTRVSVPLRGVGCFRVRRKAWTSKRFPSPCGVWVVSKLSQMSRKHKRFRPLAGCGLFLHPAA